MTISFNTASIEKNIPHESFVMNNERPPKALQSALAVDFIVQGNLDGLRNTPIAQDTTTVEDMVWQCEKLACEYEDAVLIILQKNPHIFNAVTSSICGEEKSLSDGERVLMRLLNSVSDEGFYVDGNRLSRINMPKFNPMSHQIVVPKNVIENPRAPFEFNILNAVIEKKYEEKLIRSGQPSVKEDKEDKEKNMSYVRHHFFEEVEKNPAHHKIPALCAKYLLQYGVVEFCKTFSVGVRSKAIPEYVALKILQSEVEDSKGVLHGFFGHVLALQSSKDDIKAISSLLGEFSPESIGSLFCGGGGLVLRHLVANGMAEGVESFSLLMKDLERQIGLPNIRSLLLNNVDLLGVSLTAGSSSMVNALGKMYLHFRCSDELGVSLASSLQLASAINEGHVGALRAYCKLVQDVAPSLSKKGKAKILKAMRNAELEGLILHTQRPEFKRLCADNKDFYATYKSAKNSLKP